MKLEVGQRVIITGDIWDCKVDNQYDYKKAEGRVVEVPLAGWPLIMVNGLKKRIYWGHITFAQEAESAVKTPMQELIETFEEMRSPIDNKVDVDFAISLMKSLLEKEKEQMCDFAEQWFVCFGYKSAEEYYNVTFNTKER